MSGLIIPSPSLIVVGDSPVSRAVEQGGGTVFNPEKMKLVDNDYGRSLATVDARLFLYHNTDNGNFGIAAWLYRPGQGHPTGIMTELETIDGDPYCWPDRLPSLDSLRRRMITGTQMIDQEIRRLESEKVDRANEVIDGNRRRADLVKYARSKRLERIANEIEAGIIPISDRPVDKSEWKV